jgi:hypothetical protein
MRNQVVNWIMGCLFLVSFIVFINGSTTRFFYPTRGLRQGILMPPFIFLLVVEGLNRMITTSKREGTIRVLK